MASERLIRTATNADLEAVHALVERAYRGDAARGGWTHEADLLDGQRTDLAVLGEALADPSQRILIAVMSGRVVGCVQVSDRGDGLCYLGMLSVDPELQAGGLGKRLIDEAEREAMQTFGAETMEMTVIGQRAELVAYYERRGYQLTGEARPFPYGDKRFGRPRTRDLAFVVLAKPLEAPGRTCRPRQRAADPR